MYRLVIAFALVLMLVVPAGGWERSKDSVIPGKPMDIPATRCDTAGHVPYVGPGATVPDNDPAGVLLGPIQITACPEVSNLMVEVVMTHTWIGDLIIHLIYDADCDGPEGDPYVALLERPEGHTIGLEVISLLEVHRNE